LLGLAAAFAALLELLSKETGSSLEHLYPQVPDILRGYVELVYDLHHRPDLRVSEPLLYRGPFYKPANQEISLSVHPDDSRGFALSTPRLDEPGRLILPIPFASRIIDELACARAVPKPFGFFEDMLGAASSGRIEALFTESEGRASAPSTRDAHGMTIHYYGHACLLARSARVSVMFDPVVPYKHGSGDLARYGFDDLPDVLDYVVITHNHPDHVALESLLQLRHRIRTLIVPGNTRGSVADPSLKLMFARLGFQNVQTLDDLETVEMDGGSLTALPFLGEHGDLDVRSKSSYVLRLGGRTILCAADSNNLEPRIYRLIRESVDKLDALFIGMECQGAPMSWFYGPLLSKPIIRKHDETRRLNGSDAAKALAMVDELQPSQVYVYAMGLEPWLGFISSLHYDAESLPITESNRLVEECRRRGLIAERLYGAREIALPG
jgi:L-ascorbate metabolism protein UlaG (beta-lactamase superfamily)